MNNMDDFIREIQTHEAIELKGSLDDKIQKRIEKKIFEVIKDEISATSDGGNEKHICQKEYEELKNQKSGDENHIWKKEKWEESESVEMKQKETTCEESNFLNEECRKVEGGKVKYRKRSYKVWLILAAAISLIFAFGITGAARNQWDLGIVDFMGLEDAESLELYGGEVEINVSAESHGITLTAVSSIGDKNSAYIRLETDYELPETFNPETDYILPWDVSMHISNKDEQLTKDYASTHMFLEDNGRLCFMLSISDCQDLNQSHVKLQMKDLYLYHDLHQPESTVEEELLFEGTWELEWTYQYEANAKTCRMIKRFENNGVNYYLTKVEITPISIRIEAFRMPWDREKENPEDLIQGVIYKDGTKLLIPHQSVCGVRNGMFITQFVDVGVISEVIKINEIDCIIVGGDVVALR